MPEFALTLKAARAERNLNQHQLAYLAGISQVALSRIENGLAEPHDSTKQAIEEALQFNIDWRKTFDQGRRRRTVISN